MKVKLIIFDLDGVLIDAKKIHFNALNAALGDEYKISLKDHLLIYDGLKTSKKLEILSEKTGLSVDLHKEIWKAKQNLTFEKIKKIEPSINLIACMNFLVSKGYKIAICSNSIRKTVTTIISKLGITEYIDLVISNEDVKNAKPHPDMYWKAMSTLSVLPEETLIIEDSPYGLLAASRTNAHILRVKNPNEVNEKNIINKLKYIESRNLSVIPKWSDSKLTVLIPMAGSGSRFHTAGYILPKPLIEVLGKPMIQLVIENLNIDANFIFVVQKEHRKKYNLDTILNLITPNCKIVEVDGLTEGAACTALMAKEFIDNENPLFFANSDQYVEWDSNDFFYKMNETDVDGGIVTFTSMDLKWSFVKTNNDENVIEVAEKNPISNKATVGFYYWKKGSDFVKYAEQMIQKNIRVNNEFYVAPVFNQAISDFKTIITFPIKNMWGIGTPQDLDNFNKHISNLNA